MLGSWQDVDAVPAGTEGDEDEHEGAEVAGMSRTLTPDERSLLERFVKAL